MAVRTGAPADPLLSAVCSGGRDDVLADCLLDAELLPERGAFGRRDDPGGGLPLQRRAAAAQRLHAGAVLCLRPDDQSLRLRAGHRPAHRARAVGPGCQGGDDVLPPHAPARPAVHLPHWLAPVLGAAPAVAELRGAATRLLREPQAARHLQLLRQPRRARLRLLAGPRDQRGRPRAEPRPAQGASGHDRQAPDLRLRPGRVRRRGGEEVPRGVPDLPLRLGGQGLH
mmetsp:Transcript_8947/g.23984  ORF Transcript_8947/g.23984 Transcript_8947/m.23984 type:complete len:227 (+) Transcript_8947:275-955(+)